MRLLFVFVCFAILYFTLFPWQIDSTRGAVPLSRDFPHRPADWVDALANVLLFIPFGLIGILAWPGRSWFNAATLWISGTLFTYGIEWTQRFIPTRFASWRDVLCNSLGTAIGVGLGSAMARWPVWRTGVAGKPLRSVPLVAMMTVAWVVAQSYPFFPSFHWVQAYKSWDQLIHPHLQWMETIDVLLEALLLYVVYRHTLSGWPDPARAAWVAGLRLCSILLLQAVLQGFSLTPSRIVAALLGLTAGRMAFASPGASRLRLLAAILTGWLLVRQLWPFAFSPTLLTGFSWIPFGSAFDSTAESFVRVLFAKWLLYTGTLWALRQSGLHLIAATAIVSVILGCSEWAQCWIPGRTPETTDVLLAWLGALLIAAGSEDLNGAATLPRKLKKRIVSSPYQAYTERTKEANRQDGSSQFRP